MIDSRTSLYTVVFAATALASSALADAPLVSGNLQIAKRIENGDAHILLVGDSLQNSMLGQDVKNWPVQFSSVFMGQNLGTDEGAYPYTAFVNPFEAGWRSMLASDPAWTDGVRGESPGADFHAIFTAQPSGPDDNGTLSNRIYSMTLEGDQQSLFGGGNWAFTGQGKDHIDLLVYANPNGQKDGLVFNVVGSSSSTALASMNISAYSPTPKIVKYSLTIDAPPASSTGINAEVQLQGNFTPTQGSNLVVVGARAYTDQNSFQLTDIAWGGTTVDYFLHPYATDQNLADFINMTDSDIGFFWIGTNGMGDVDRDTYKNQILSLIARYRTARPDMQFVLVGGYDLGLANSAPYADALNEIAQSDPSVLFLNMYKASGDYAFLQANYLQDTVHPNAAGATYFSNELWSLIDQAAQAPEPGSLSILGLGAAVGLMRCRRSP